MNQQVVQADGRDRIRQCLQGHPVVARRELQLLEAYRRVTFHDLELFIEMTGDRNPLHPANDAAVRNS